MTQAFPPLIRYNKALTALAECVRVDEIKAIHDQAMAMQLYAKQAKDTKLIEAATEIRLRAERKAGELLAAMPKNRGTRGQLKGDIPVGGHVSDTAKDNTPTLKELGISKRQSSKWQQLADLSQPEFEAKVTTVKFAASQKTTTAPHYKFRDRQSGTGRRTKARFASASVLYHRRIMPPINTPAFNEKRTEYPTTVIRDLDAYPYRLLKGGANDPKVGGIVLKGRWKGFSIFTLTLEERATCPTECRHWCSCYGNKMHMAHRFAHGPKFEAKLVSELRELGKKRPAGFVVRLHVLGDFYSVEYVQLWAEMLEEIPQLHVFGYTARHDAEIGGALRELVEQRWERFAIRFSNAEDWRDVPATISIEHLISNPADAIICPEQNYGKTESCSTCGLCWGTKRRIAFLYH